MRPTTSTLAALIAMTGCHARPTAQPPAVAGAPISTADGVTRCGPHAAPAELPASPRGGPVREPMSLSSRPAATSAAAFSPADPARGVLEGRRGQILGCYQKLLAWEPDAGGKVQTRFTIKRDGSVSDVEVRGLQATMDACVCEVLAGLRFGPTIRGVVRYPLIFSH
ncbi:MAG: AgmX/PglI C-terminal domain-containing protein [Myxococcales bacterium]|nr:AgmX/PglI C-terminal domain-containing protein [Myxococcales bacterium]